MIWLKHIYFEVLIPSGNWICMAFACHKTLTQITWNWASGLCNAFILCVTISLVWCRILTQGSASVIFIIIIPTQTWDPISVANCCILWHSYFENMWWNCGKIVIFRSYLNDAFKNCFIREVDILKLIAF